MATKLLFDEVLTTVVIKAWPIPGPGDDANNPRWLSSYELYGLPAVVMKGDGLESQEEAALLAVNAVAASLKAVIAQFPSD
jgi:hypothetical protein